MVSKRVREELGDAPLASKQSPVVREVDTGVKGLTAQHREDRTVTIRLNTGGVAPKVVTMYPLQWQEFCRHAAQISAACNGQS